MSEYKIWYDMLSNHRIVVDGIIKCKMVTTIPTPVRRVGYSHQYLSFISFLSYRQTRLNKVKYSNSIQTRGENERK